MSDHYFTRTPDSPGRPRTVSFTVRGGSYELATSTGVFSADRLDLGTAVLLRSAPYPQAGTVLDLGCGYGPIACVLARTVPALSVWAVDVNRRALDLTRANADRLGVGDRVRVAEPDAVPALDDVPAGPRFDEIWSNPPVRIGKAALHTMLDRWLPTLRSDGVAWMVVARNLGADSLQRRLWDQDWSCERYGSAKGYRVLRLRRP